MDQELREILQGMSAKIDHIYEQTAELLEFKTEMLAFKEEMLAFKEEMMAFKEEMMIFKEEMLAFKKNTEYRMGELEESMYNIERITSKNWSDIVRLKDAR